MHTANAVHRGYLSHSTYTFKEANLLGDDLVMRGINPRHDFYVPSSHNLVKVKVHLHLKTPGFLRKDSTITIAVNDKPFLWLPGNGLDRKVSLTLQPIRGEDFIKVSVIGNLRVSNNICEDVFSDKAYIIIDAQDSYLEFFYWYKEDIHSFLRDYSKRVCINSPQLLPLAYYLNALSGVPRTFVWGESDCVRIEASPDKTIYVRNKTLYVPTEGLIAFLEDYRRLLFGQRVVPVYVEAKKGKETYDRLSFRELGIGSTTVRGVGNLSVSIPVDTAKIGGLPDRLFLRLFYTHTPRHEKDKMELRVYINDDLIRSYPIEGNGGEKSIDIEIPSSQLVYGKNNLSVNLVNFTSSDNCFGATTQSVLTVSDKSYFYWSSVRKEPIQIQEFLKTLSGNVGLIIQDESLTPILLKLLSEVAKVNKNIRSITVLNSPEKAKEYDFLIHLKKVNEKAFEIYNPISGKKMFSSEYSEPFVYMYLSYNGDIPVLNIASYKNPDVKAISELYTIEEYLRFYGNYAIITKNYALTYEVGEKLRIRYPDAKGVAYYWNKYKGVFLVLVGIVWLYFSYYVYKKLTRRPQ
ncbi:MAG: cellulose biosynthesis cyclic di-GMP-binding regulatory protein BcsB [Aquificaceae bacterium]|nr:cellulose biosynthesis cyclic di-GMP-binding regulatory protein BcsB [Aquificaceae bacterium]